MTKIYDQQRFKPPKVGDEVHRLRRAHGLTLDELATKSGVSKAILSQIEHDKSNPTLSTIWRITQALDHPLEDLLSSNKPSSPFEKLKYNATPSVASEDGGFTLRILGLVSMLASVQWYEFEAQPGSCLISESHGTGSIESISLLKGALEIEIEENRKMVEAGETLRYGTETAHKLTNIGKGVCHGFMVNLLSPTL